MGGKRKTPEEFMAMMTKVHPTIKVLGTFKNTRTPIDIVCLTDGHQWQARPYNLYSGKGCPQCGHKRTHQKQTLSHADFMKMMVKKHPHIEVLETYQNMKTYIRLRCKEDQHEWQARPYNLHGGKGCPKCGHRKTGEKKSLSHATFMQRMADQHPNIQVLGKYASDAMKVSLRCLVDGNEWQAAPTHLREGTGCPQCGRKKTGAKSALSHATFMQRMADQHPNIQVLGKYAGDAMKVSLRCLIDEHKWEASPTHLHQGKGCPKCKIKKITQIKTLSPSIFRQIMAEKHPTLEIIGQYQNMNTHIQLRCKVDGHVWHAKPSNLRTGHGCPCCAKTGYTPSKTGFFYWTQAKDHLLFGITNVPKRRLSEHRKNLTNSGLDYEKFHLLEFTLGHEAQNLERKIKENLKTKYNGIDVDGFKDEALPIKQYSEFMRILSEFRNQYTVIDGIGH